MSAMLIPTPIDTGVMTQAVGLAAAFSFGALEILFETVPSKLKPYLYVGLTSFLSVAVYLALISTNPWVMLLVAAVSVSTSVTGGVKMLHKDVLKKPESNPV